MSLDGLSPETRAKLQALLSEYSDRLNLEAAARRDLAEAVASVEALVAHGHPDEPTAIVDEEMLAELDTRLDAMTAARRKFRAAAETK